MMGYNEIANQDQLNFLDPFKGSNSHKLRPLAPRLLNFSPPNYNTSLSLNYTNHRHQNHHFGGAVGLSEESNSKEMVGTNQVMVSSRWNPTPEQLRALENMYRQGTRTPSAEQIQYITAQLRRYGKIEGKNVFYWFQNHKARERQKRRRQLQLHPSPPGSTTSEGNKVGFEGEQKSYCKWTPSPVINKQSKRPIIQIISEEEAEATVDETSTITITTQFHDPSQFQHNHNANNNINNNPNNNIHNISNGTNLMFAGERNVTCHNNNNNNNNNNNMVQQQPSSLSSFSCCYQPCQSHSHNSFYPYYCSSKCNTNSIQSKHQLLPDNQVVNNCEELETPPLSSPTLQLFPVHNNDQENYGINVKMSKEKEVNNDAASLLLLQTTCCNVVDKETNIVNSISNYNYNNNNNNNNNNNPFPYYQFL